MVDDNLDWVPNEQEAPSIRIGEPRTEHVRLLEEPDYLELTIQRHERKKSWQNLFYVVLLFAFIAFTFMSIIWWHWGLIAVIPLIVLGVWG